MKEREYRMLFAACDFLTLLERGSRGKGINPWARFLNVPIIFRAQKAILCVRCFVCDEIFLVLKA